MALNISVLEQKKTDETFESPSIEGIILHPAIDLDSDQTTELLMPTKVVVSEAELHLVMESLFN